MSASADEAKQNDGTADISVSMDGKWQRRGFSSLNGVVVAVSTSNFSKFSMWRSCREIVKLVHSKRICEKQTRSSTTNGRPFMNQAATPTKKVRQEVWRWLVL